MYDMGAKWYSHNRRAYTSMSPAENINFFSYFRNTLPGSKEYIGARKQKRVLGNSDQKFLSQHLSWEFLYLWTMPFDVCFCYKIYNWSFFFTSEPRLVKVLIISHIDLYTFVLTNLSFYIPPPLQ